MSEPTQYPMVTVKAISRRDGLPGKTAPAVLSDPASTSLIRADSAVRIRSFVGR